MSCKKYDFSSFDMIDSDGHFSIDILTKTSFRCLNGTRRQKRRWALLLTTMMMIMMVMAIRMMIRMMMVMVMRMKRIMSMSERKLAGRTRSRSGHLSTRMLRTSGTQLLLRNGSKLSNSLKKQIFKRRTSQNFQPRKRSSRPQYEHVSLAFAGRPLEKNKEVHNPIIISHPHQ